MPQTQRGSCPAPLFFQRGCSDFHANFLHKPASPRFQTNRALDMGPNSVLDMGEVGVEGQVAHASDGPSGTRYSSQSPIAEMPRYVSCSGGWSFHTDTLRHRQTHTTPVCVCSVDLTARSLPHLRACPAAAASPWFVHHFPLRIAARGGGGRGARNLGAWVGLGWVWVGLRQGACY